MSHGPQVPTVGRIVHYVGFGTPNGEYGQECRAAIITDANPAQPKKASLAVLNPSGLFFKENADYDDPGAEHSGDPNCPAADRHGDPFRYCACGWMEAHPAGGTWHWPEQA